MFNVGLGSVKGETFQNETKLFIYSSNVDPVRNELEEEIRVPSSSQRRVSNKLVVK